MRSRSERIAELSLCGGADLANADNPVEQRLHTGRESVKINSLCNTELCNIKRMAGKIHHEIYNAARSTGIMSHAPAADFRAAAGRRAGQVAAEPAFTCGAPAAAATCIRRCVAAWARPQLTGAEEVGVGGCA